jgi:hypothetical protein
MCRDKVVVEGTRIFGGGGGEEKKPDKVEDVQSNVKQL